MKQYNILYILSEGLLLTADIFAYYNTQQYIILYVYRMYHLFGNAKYFIRMGLNGLFN